jgi:hypothetical protein
MQADIFTETFMVPFYQLVRGKTLFSTVNDYEKQFDPAPQKSYDETVHS